MHLCKLKSCLRVERTVVRTPAVALAALTSILALFSAQSGAQAPSPKPEQVVITASGVERRLFDTPYAVGVVDEQALRAAGPMVNLSEALARVPGLVVANRSNYAQDLQISIRGFGARSSFGVRGMRLYTDGIPATMPDGQGSLSHIDIASLERVEVLRGPYSALYGNSAGGVVSLFTETPEGRPFVEGGVSFGSSGQQLRSRLLHALFDLLRHQFLSGHVGGDRDGHPHRLLRPRCLLHRGT